MYYWRVQQKATAVGLLLLLGETILYIYMYVNQKRLSDVIARVSFLLFVLAASDVN